MARRDDRRIDLAGTVLTDARSGAPVDLGDLSGTTLLSAIRHRFWLPCQQHLVQVQEEADRAGGPALVAVGFSPPEALGEVADHLGWRGRFLADPELRVYRLLGLDRAPWWRVYSPGTLAVYARALAGGERGRAPVEDTRRLGGDAVVRDGVVVTRWRPRSPDDRAEPADLVAAAL